MITVFLRGGLGNQMFQYALGLTLAKKNDSALLLDTVFLSDKFPRKDFAYRTFDLDIFTLTPHLTPLSYLADSLPVPGLYLGIDLAFATMKNALGIQNILREKNNFFDPLVLRTKGNLFLFGRWQSERYFEEVANEARSAFKFRYPLEGEAASVGDLIETANAISIHIRRGDFATSQTVVKLMGSTDLAYYERAARYMAERVKNPHFFVFSDDVKWCEEHLRTGFVTTYVAVAGPKGAYHMDLMSRCKHNIIANSTFSWWGAWLNDDPNKIVVAPKKWFADETEEGDIVPKSWVRL